MFVYSLHLRQLATKESNELDLLLSPEEFSRALKHMPNKDSGPDGFPAEYYKHFWNILTFLFNRMIMEIKLTLKLPLDMNTAIISLLLKPNKHPTLPSS